MGTKNNEEKQFMELLNQLNYPLLDRTLRAYLERCKFIHALVFLQFRRLLPGAPITSIKEMFEDRQEYLLKILDKV